MLGRGQSGALLGVLRCENLEAAAQLEARLEHVDIVVVMFDVEHFGHDTESIPLVTLMTPAASAISLTPLNLKRCAPLFGVLQLVHAACQIG